MNRIYTGLSPLRPPPGATLSADGHHYLLKTKGTRRAVIGLATGDGRCYPSYALRKLCPDLWAKAYPQHALPEELNAGLYFLLLKAAQQSGLYAALEKSLPLSALHNLLSLMQTLLNPYATGHSLSFTGVRDAPAPRFRALRPLHALHAQSALQEFLHTLKAQRGGASLWLRICRFVHGKQPCTLLMLLDEADGALLNLSCCEDTPAAVSLNALQENLAGDGQRLAGLFYDAPDALPYPLPLPCLRRLSPLSGAHTALLELFSLKLIGTSSRYRLKLPTLPGQSVRAAFLKENGYLKCLYLDKRSVRQRDRYLRECLLLEEERLKGALNAGRRRLYVLPPADFALSLGHQGGRRCVNMDGLWTSRYLDASLFTGLESTLKLYPDAQYVLLSRLALSDLPLMLFRRALPALPLTDSLNLLSAASVLLHKLSLYALQRDLFLPGILRDVDRSVCLKATGACRFETFFNLPEDVASLFRSLKLSRQEMQTFTATLGEHLMRGFALKEQNFS